MTAFEIETEIETEVEVETEIEIDTETEIEIEAIVISTNGEIAQVSALLWTDFQVTSELYDEISPASR